MREREQAPDAASLSQVVERLGQLSVEAHFAEQSICVERIVYVEWPWVLGRGRLGIVVRQGEVSAHVDLRLARGASEASELWEVPRLEPIVLRSLEEARREREHAARVARAEQAAREAEPELRDWITAHPEVRWLVSERLYGDPDHADVYTAIGWRDATGDRVCAFAPDFRSCFHVDDAGAVATLTDFADPNAESTDCDAEEDDCEEPPYVGGVDFGNNSLDPRHGFLAVRSRQPSGDVRRGPWTLVAAMEAPEPLRRFDAVLVRTLSPGLIDVGEEHHFQCVYADSWTCNDGPPNTDADETEPLELWILSPTRVAITFDAHDLNNGMDSEHENEKLVVLYAREGASLRALASLRIGRSSMVSWNGLDAEEADPERHTIATGWLFDVSVESECLRLRRHRFRGRDTGHFRSREPRFRPVRDVLGLDGRAPLDRFHDRLGDSGPLTAPDLAGKWCFDETEGWTRRRP